MTDPRIKKLADVLVNYSTAVQPGDWVVITSSYLAEPLAMEVLRAVLQAGGNPTLHLESDRTQETTLTYASDDQLSWISPVHRMIYNEADVSILILATDNTRFLSNADPHKQQVQNQAWGELLQVLINRAAAGELRWTLTQYPCPAYAQDAHMSLKEYQDFIHRATFTDQDDPVAAWRKVHDEQQRMIDFLQGKEKVVINSPHAELELSIKGRPFKNSDGRENMPSGEIYTSPVEDSAQGWVKFTYPAINQGREVTGVRLEFKDGRVVDASAEKNQEYLLAMLDLDPGARYLGEFAIGTNYGIEQFTGSILYDEKIGGSFHVALGNGFPEAGGKNSSSLHWDLICDIKEDSQIQVDGELLYQDGRFVI